MGFDIRDALLERGYPTAKVQIWISDEIFYKIESIEDQIKHTPEVQKIAIADLEGQLEALWRERDEQAYTVHLRGISVRSGEDIISKALAAWPIKRDYFGRDDDAMALERQKLMREMQLAAHLVKVVDPEGNEQRIETEEDHRDVARSILAEAPRVTLNILDQAMMQLSKEFKEQVQKQQDPDFLSKH